MAKAGQLANQIILTLIVALLLIILVFVTIGIPFTGKSLTNSNSNTYKETTANSIITQQRICETVQIPYQTFEIYADYLDYRTYNLDRDYLSYMAYKDYEVFGNYIERFMVRIKNTDNQPGYFTVKFVFYEHYGDAFTISLTRYIKPGQTEKFVYQDISGNKNYRGWTYDVVAPKKSSQTNYYGTYYYDYYGDNYYRDYYNNRYHYPSQNSKIVTKYKTQQRCYWIT